MKTRRGAFASMLICIVLIIVLLSDSMAMIASAAPLASISPTRWTFEPQKKVREWIVPKTGTYEFTVVGGRGGFGLDGGYIKGRANLTKGTKYYIAVGGNGSISPDGSVGGWNGGGSSSTKAGSGGGATCVYTALYGDGQLVNYATHTNDIVLVAGGGGGCYYSETTQVSAYRTIPWGTDSGYGMSGLSEAQVLCYNRTGYGALDWHDLEGNARFGKKIDAGYGIRCNTYYKTEFDYNHTYLVGVGGTATAGVRDITNDITAYLPRGSAYGNAVPMAGYDTGGTGSFGVGQNANTKYNQGYTGAGGGGYYGGKSVDTNLYRCAVGGGGSGYIKSGFFLFENYVNSVTRTTGSSSGVTIDYIPEQVTLNVRTYNYGGENGVVGDLNVTKDSEMTQDLSNIRGKNGYTLRRFAKRDNTGDGRLNGKIFTFGHKDDTYDAIFQTNYVARNKLINVPSYAIPGTTMWLPDVMYACYDEADNVPKTFIVERSINDAPYSSLSADEQNAFSYYDSSYLWNGGTVQVYTVPMDGLYELYCLGAGGNGLCGQYQPSPGGMACGRYSFKEGEQLYIYVGTIGNNWNGGGDASFQYTVWGNTTRGQVGCGATDIRLIPSTASDGWSGNESLLSRLVTAGGGAGYGSSMGRAFDGGTALYYFRNSTGHMDRFPRYSVYGAPSSNGVLGQGSASVGSSCYLYNDDEIRDMAYGTSGGGGGGWFGGSTQGYSRSAHYDWYSHWGAAYLCTVYGWSVESAIAQTSPFLDQDGVRMMGVRSDAHAGTNNVQISYGYNGRTLVVSGAYSQDQYNTTYGKASIRYVNSSNSHDYEGSYRVKDVASPKEPKPQGLYDYVNNYFTIHWDWNGVYDNGTKYKFRITCKDAGDGGTVGTYEPSPYTNTSGVYGFYYYIDDLPSGHANTSHTFTVSDFALDASYDGKYLHAATIDRAGNLSPTVTIQLSKNFTVEFDANTTGYTGTMPDQIIQYNQTTNLNPNAFVKYGYTFVKWTTNPNGTGDSYTNMQSVYCNNLVQRYGQKVRLYAQWTPNRHTIYYNKNENGATLYGGNSATVYFDSAVDVKKNPHYTTRPGWEFMGWSLGRTSTSFLAKTGYPCDSRRSDVVSKIFDPAGTYILKEDRDLTLYAIHKKALTLQFAKDDVTSDASKKNTLSMTPITIWNHDTLFNFNSSAVTSASSRATRSYTVTFKNNGTSVAKDTTGGAGVKFTDNISGRTLAMSDAYNASSKTITAYRHFEGWSESAQASAVNVSRIATANNGAFTINPSNYTGTIIGTSGSSFAITCNDGASTFQNYSTKGNRNVAVNLRGQRATSSAFNDLVVVYPQYSRAYVKLPDCERKQTNSLTDPDYDEFYTPRETIDSDYDDPRYDTDGTDEDKFLGWFTKPQPEDGGTGDGGEYYGGPGDIVRIDGDVILYPWFNVAPTIVHGIIPDGFYEGQSISYNDLLTLVNARDLDNPEKQSLTTVPYDGSSSVSTNKKGTITYDGSREWIRLYKLNARNYLENDMGLSTVQANEILSNVNYSQFTPSIVSVKYYCNGKDSKGNQYSDSIARNQTGVALGNDGLNTSKERVGKIEITYQITDNGIYNGNTQLTNSRITVQYILTSEIKFNNLPTLDLTSAALYSTDSNLTADKIAKHIAIKQNAMDVEDDITNAPWWYKDEMKDRNNVVLLHSDTANILDGTVKVLGVYGIEISSRYEDEHPTEAAAAKSITTLADLWELKINDPETFKHITSYRVEFDCIDQWGKTASGYVYDTSEVWDKDHPEIETPYPGPNPGQPDGPDTPQPEYGQSKTERSIIITPFNNQDDLDLLLANVVVSERLRYIDRYWSFTKDTLGGMSYWGDNRTSGLAALQTVFDIYAEQHNKTGAPKPVSITILHGQFNNDAGHVIDITVNDFSD